MNEGNISKAVKRHFKGEKKSKPQCKADLDDLRDLTKAVLLNDKFYDQRRGPQI